MLEVEPRLIRKIGNKMSKVMNLRGELGNQMFQVAAGLSLSQHYKSEVKFKVPRGVTSRLSEFNCSKHLYVYEDSSHKEQIKEFLKAKSKRIHFKNEYREIGINFQDLTGLDAEFLSGFFHSWRYFHHLNSEIQSAFALLKPSENFELLSKALGTEFTGIHIRRGGSGAAILNSNFHGLVDEDFYNRAIKMSENLGGSTEYVIFTDNLAKASEVIQKLKIKPRKVISPADIDSQVENLHLMAQSSGFIGANSSYSWWAAYLAKNLVTPPIFPRQWYMDPELSNADMLLPDWITIGFEKFANEAKMRGLDAKSR
jgi:hypothetical protein